MTMPEVPDFNFHQGSGALDLDLGQAMDVAFELISLHPKMSDTPDQLRMRIVASNLRAISNVLLIADDNPEAISINTKQLVLGILGTADWLIKNLPELQDDVRDVV